MTSTEEKIPTLLSHKISTNQKRTRMYISVYVESKGGQRTEFIRILRLFRWKHTQWLALG